MKQHFYETRYFIGHEKHKMDIYIYMYRCIYVRLKVLCILAATMASKLEKRAQQY